jgi:hypothetical protein
MDWPTPETAAMWKNFAGSFAVEAAVTWKEHLHSIAVKWSVPKTPPSGMPLRLYPLQDATVVMSPDGDRLGTTIRALNPARRGLVRAFCGKQQDRLDIRYLGPDDLWLGEADQKSSY